MTQRRPPGSQDARRPLGMQDALWLEMDRPNNLMVVDSVIWTAQPLDFAKVRAVVEERLIKRYPVFRSRPVREDDGTWWWEPDSDFDFDNHVVQSSGLLPELIRRMSMLHGLLELSRCSPDTKGIQQQSTTGPHHCHSSEG